MTDPSSLPAALVRAAARHPERGIEIFDGRGRRSERRTYPEVLAGVERGAGRWAALGVAAGDRVLVSLPSSWDWFDAWLGALWQGALPVALAPAAGLGAAEAHVQKLAEVAALLGACRALAPAAARTEAERVGVSLPTGLLVSPEELAATTPATAARDPRPDPEEVAFLQLTSGSTGTPRAVAIPHRAALYNARAMREAVTAPHRGEGADADPDALVSWLPLHHDMGLVGCFLLSLIYGYDLDLFQPTTFLARPRPWLERLGSRRAALTAAPNFGYHLCVERLGGDPAALAGLDLSGWRDAMSGAEMIRGETVEAFTETFAPHGFRPGTMRACYGLAEATLAVTLDRRGEGVRFRPLPEGMEASLLTSREVAAVGEPLAGTEVRVTGPSGDALPAEAIGEIEVRSPGVFAGYWGDPEATAETLVDGWLKTGDLGFFAAGELHVTGRSKDLLIVRGHNMAPDELERLADGVAGGGGMLRSAAFSVARDGRGEEPVLVVEAGERDPARLAALAHEIRSRVGHALSLPLADVAFVRRGKIPKTTSGKVQRREIRRLYLAGELERLDVETR